MNFGLGLRIADLKTGFKFEVSGFVRPGCPPDLGCSPGSGFALEAGSDSATSKPIGSLHLGIVFARRVAAKPSRRGAKPETGAQPKCKVSLTGGAEPPPHIKRQSRDERNLKPQ